MKITIDDALFANPSAHVDLSLLVGRGKMRRFRVMPDDLNGPGVSSWLQAQSVRVADDYRTIFDIAVELDSRSPSLITVKVEDTSTSIWTSLPIRLTLSDAIGLTQRPFSIVVENRVNDRAFLLAVASQEARRELVELEKEGTLQFENGGGVGTMVQTLTADLDSAERSAIPISKFFLFDSDALSPDEPSAQSESLRRLCASLRIPHYQLRRRAIENYIPCNTMRHWVHGSNKRRQRKERVFMVYVAMSESQRAHFPVKDGFTKPYSVTLYSTLSEPQRRDIHSGFGSSVTSIFREIPIELRELERHGVNQELSEPIGNILRTIC